MHHLHTTDAFVVASIPHGESSLVYRLFTREFGLLYAHGQGVRELRNRNRYALRTGGRVIVTLVEGRSVWRITGTQDVVSTYEHQPNVYVARRLITLVSRFLPAEDPVPELFALLEQGIDALALYPELTTTIETVTALRLLRELGYVKDPDTPSHPTTSVFTVTRLSHEVLTTLRPSEKVLVREVNNALEHANE